MQYTKRIDKHSVKGIVQPFELGGETRLIPYVKYVVGAQQLS
jgi:hypothetical protein